MVCIGYYWLKETDKKSTFLEFDLKSNTIKLNGIFWSVIILVD